MSRNKNLPPLKKIVEERIDLLLKKAKEAYAQRPADSKKYIKLARKLSMRHRIAMGRQRKKLFCRECNTPLIEKKTLTIEKNKDWLIYSCECGAKRKFHI